MSAFTENRELMNRELYVHDHLHLRRLLPRVLVLRLLFPGEVYAGEEKTRLGYLRERKESVYENLRDLNFEYKAGKVPDADYQSMRASLEEEAAAIMAEIARLEQAAVGVNG